MEIKHSPLPWKAFQGELSNINDALIARVYSGQESSALLAKAIGAAESDENAAFIVRACNSHDDLVEALEAALANAVFEKQAFRPWHDMARAALAKAKGEA